ncbi:hypothetical protein M758_9G101300 [Ceratodon purpureus]|nr:hypothetical protein M758_9G101300 [Ceratodon purpureus]
MPEHSAECLVLVLALSAPLPPIACKRRDLGVAVFGTQFVRFPWLRGCCSRNKGISDTVQFGGAHHEIRH